MQLLTDLFKTHHPHLHYHAEFGPSTSKTGECCGPAPLHGMRSVAEPLDTCPSPRVTLSNLFVLGQTVGPTSVIMEIHLKIS